MIFLVEGIDRVGKSTLCDKLSKVTGAVVFRANSTQFVSNSDKDIYNEADKAYKLYKLAYDIGSDAIFDRMHLSDVVYATLRRGFDLESSFEVFKKIDEVANVYGVNVIYIKPDEQGGLSRCEKMAGESLEQDLKFFDRVYDMSICNKVCIHTSDIDDAIDAIKMSRTQHIEG